MDVIQFGVTNSTIEDYLTTIIFINGFDLKDILADLEIDQAKCDLSRKFVGAYEGISPFIAFHMHKHFLKDTIKEYTYLDNRYTLFECEHSGITGEHTVACQINFKEDIVEWSNFKSFSSILKDSFDYPDLKFHFDRSQYEKAIKEFVNTEIKSFYT